MRRVVPVALLITASLTLAVWGTWPTVARLSTHVIDGPGLAGPFPATIQADVYDTLWILAWDTHALATRPTALFDANIFHPARGTLALAEHMLGALPMYLPLALASGDPVLAHQGTLVLSFAAAFLAAAALVRDWTGSWPAAGLGGVLFAFSAFRISNLDNLQTLGNYWLPLVPLCARRAVVDRRWRWPILGALALVLQALHSYYVGYAAFFAAAILLGIVLAGSTEARRRWPRLVVPLVVAAAVVVLSAVPYFTIRHEHAIGPPAHQLVRVGSAPLGRTGASTALVVAVATLPFWRHGTPGIGAVWSIGLAAVAVASHLMAIGPELEVVGQRFAGPYALAREVLPGLGMARVPGRFNATATMALAALAGIGAAGLCRRFRGAASATGVGVVALAVASMYRPLPLRPVAGTRDVPPAYRALAHIPPGPVVEIPYHDLERNPFAFEVEAERMYLSVYHWQPILNGFSSHLPVGYGTVSALVAQLPDPGALRELVRTTGLRYVLVHRAELAPGEWRRWRRLAEMRVGGVFGRDVLLIDVGG